MSVRGTLGVGIVVGIMALAVGLVRSPEAAHAAGTSVQTTTLRFNIAEAVEVTSWPTSEQILGATVSPGASARSDGLLISVKANAKWWLQISSDSEDGRLREYDLAQGDYVPNGMRTS